MQTFKMGDRVIFRKEFAIGHSAKRMGQVGTITAIHDLPGQGALRVDVSFETGEPELGIYTSHLDHATAQPKDSPATLIRHARMFANKYGRPASKPAGEAHTVMVERDGFHIVFTWPSKAKGNQGSVNIQFWGTFVFHAVLEPDWTEEESGNFTLEPGDFVTGLWQNELLDLE
jgi:hypothetical protein